MEKILVIDSDYASGVATKNMISSIGLPCSLVSNLADALRASSTFDYTIIVTDAVLFIQNQSDFRRGWEQSARCFKRRGISKTFSSKIVGVLSTDSVAVKKQCWEAGMADVAVKPLLSDSLYECICCVPHATVAVFSNTPDQSRLELRKRACTDGADIVDHLFEDVAACQDMVMESTIENGRHGIFHMQPCQIASGRRRSDEYEGKVRLID